MCSELQHLVELIIVHRGGGGGGFPGDVVMMAGRQ